MTSRWSIRHTIAHDYPGGAAENQNELRVWPADDAVQTVLHHRTLVTPSARVLAHDDYWGTRVETFGVRGRHERLVVVAESEVVVGPRPSPPGGVGLALLDGLGFHDAHVEFLEPSPLVEPGERVAALAGPVPAEDVVGLVVALRDAVRGAVAQSGTATEVGTTVEDVLEAGRGVGQDRAHVLVAALRHRRVPARYVSGHVATDGVDASTHAWVEAAVPGAGWFAVDPSSRDAVDERFVTLGRGRDYGDVPPQRGTYVGEPDREPSVTVEMRHEGGEDAPAPGGPVHVARRSQSQSQG